ncbi:unnamed protein product, partial [Callosobruchus maculatus]
MFVLDVTQLLRGYILVAPFCFRYCLAQLNTLTDLYACHPETKTDFVVVLTTWNAQVLCAGTLINSKWVLTSADCGQMQIVMAGMSTNEIPKLPMPIDPQTIKAIEEMFEKNEKWSLIDRFVLHKRCDPINGRNNIGLAKLERPISEGPDVSYVKLPKYRWKKDFHKQCPKVTAVGFGIFTKLVCFETDMLPSSECSTLAASIRDKESILCTKDKFMIGPGLGAALMCNGVQYGVHISDEVYVKVDSYLRFILKKSTGTGTTFTTTLTFVLIIL